VGKKSSAGATVCTFCADGKTTSEVGQSSCDNCPAGKYGDNGSGLCLLCPKGKSNIGNGITNGLVATTCPISCATGESAHGTACQACVEGKYSAYEEECWACPAGK